MRFTVRAQDGEDLEFESADTLDSRWFCTDILEGRTYPWLPFVSDVRVILDVGANCGAATVYFAQRCPDARVHALEPGSEQRAILDRNAADHPNVSVHPFGLAAADRDALLYRGIADTGQSSIFRSQWTVDEGEPVALRSAAGWVAEQGIDRIDILKIDVEGCEVEVLESLTPEIPAVKVLYVEYDSRAARRAIEALLGPTHELYLGKVLLDQGELLYLRADLADLPAAGEHLAELLRANFTASTP